MTEMARRLLDTLHRHLATPPPDAAAAVSDRAMLVEVRLPGSLPAHAAEQLTTELRRQLSALLHEFRLDRELVVTAPGTQDGSTVATVSIDGRPVAHLDTRQLPPDGAEHDLLSGVMSRTLRRLPLLAGPGVGPRSTAAYLMALGCRVPPGTDTEDLDVDQAERLIDERTDEEIVVQVAASTMRRVDRSGAAAVVEFREVEFRRRGVVYPDIRVELTDDRPGSVRLKLNDVTLPVRRLGADAGWSDVVRHLGQELTGLRHWFVRMRDVEQAMDEDLVYVLPDLVAVAEANYSRGQITAGMRELVRSGRRMRNFPRILWLLIEAGGSPAGSDVLRMSEAPLLPKARHRPPAERDPIVQAVRVRKLAAEEDWRLGNYRAPHPAARLAADVEARLVAGGQPEALAAAEWAAVRAVAAMPTERIVTRSVAALGPVRDAVQAVADPPRVRTSHELPPDADVDAFPVLAEPAVDR